jgi:hypothetical protein
LCPPVFFRNGSLVGGYYEKRAITGTPYAD